MNKLYVDLRKIGLKSYNGIFAAIALFLALVFMCYALLHNPYKEVHEQIFKTADNIRKYYADHPGYWKLSTQSAVDNHLIAGSLTEHKEFEVKIGIGENGEMAMPSDNTFDIVLSNLNKASCIGLTEAKISSTGQLALQKITVINENGSTEFMWGDDKHPLPAAKYSARTICLPTGNTILWTFQ